MSILVQSPNNHRIQNSYIEWDTVRGRGDFDAGYVNEFLYTNENGEVDEQKRKEFEENPQFKLIRTHKSSSSIRRSRQNPKVKASSSDTQVVKKVRKTRTVKLSSQKQSIQGSQTKSEINISDLKDSE